MTTVSYILSVNPHFDLHTNIEDHDVGHLILSDPVTKPSENSTPSIPPTLKQIFDADEEDSNAEAYYANDDPRRLIRQMNEARAIMEMVWSNEEGEGDEIAWIDDE